MRLRSLRRLEEIEIRREHDKLTKERKGLRALLQSEPARWKRICEELEDVRKKFGSGPLGDRRTELGTAPASVDFSFEAMVEREAITVILSDKLWIRAVKGAVADPAELKFKEGDKLRMLLPCHTTDRLVLFATNGKSYTLKAADVPRGRGDGQALRLIADLQNEDDAVALFVPIEGMRYLVASSSGRGFIVPAAELGAEKRTGKQILNLKPGEEGAICVVADGDHIALIGQNRRMLIFPLDQIPEMARGSGVILQRYKDGGLSDAKVFRLADGLTWRLGDRTRTETDLRDWLGERAQAGRMPPNGFPKGLKF
jgi:topoisomerase-4 subunit A